MYNVKVLKYPSGWQIRTYSRPVGYCDKKEDDDCMLRKVIVNAETGETDTRFIDYKTMWFNPFTAELETVPLVDVDDLEKKKKHSLQSSRCRTINRVYHLVRSNVWDWFLTLTFNPDKIDSFDYEQCVKALQNWLIVQRRTCCDLKYVIVPELHESGRFHFHGLFAQCDGLEFVESGHFTKDGQPIYNVGRYKLGWSTATKVVNNERVTKYITKYITKELCGVAFGKKRYWASRNLDDVEAETYILEANKFAEYSNYFESGSQWNKTIESSDLITRYYEMGVIDDV